MMRIILFIATNFAVLLLAMVVTAALEPWLASQGIEFDRLGLLIFALGLYVANAVAEVIRASARVHADVLSLVARVAKYDDVSTLGVTEVEHFVPGHDRHVVVHERDLEPRRRDPDAVAALVHDHEVANQQRGDHRTRWNSKGLEHEGAQEQHRQEN